MPSKGFKSKPQDAHVYPAVPFHLLRFLQLLSSCIISGIMFYFIGHLMRGKWKIPWMYYFLQGAALLSLIYLVSSGLVRCIWGISAFYNSLANGFLTILWAVAFALLADSMKDTILRQCTTSLWGSGTGVTICVLYKMLFSASFIGTLSFMAATVLDILVCRRKPGKGKYVKAVDVSDDTAYKPHA